MQINRHALRLPTIRNKESFHLNDYSYAQHLVIYPWKQSSDVHCFDTRILKFLYVSLISQAASVVYPSTEQEILDAMATAVRSNQKIKVSTTYGHSIPKLACPGSSSGFIINSKKYTAIVNIDTTKSTATAQGCIQLRSLVDAVATHGLALPVALYWDGVTLAGVLSTGAHGSSLLWKGGAVHEYVIGMRLVTPASAGEGYAKIRVLGRDDKELNAAKLSLRMLGVISTVILQLESTYERSVTKNLAAEEDGMEDEILRIGQTEEFEDVIWYPALGEVVYRYARLSHT